MKLFQTHFIFYDIFIPHNQLANNQFWLIKNEILLKQFDRQFSAFVLTTGEYYSEEIAKKKIFPFLTSSAFLIHKTTNLQISGYNEIKSIKELGKKIPVGANFHIGTRIGLKKDLLLSIKSFYKVIHELNEQFLFLENGSTFLYDSTRYKIDKYKIKGFENEQFINSFIV